MDPQVKTIGFYGLVGRESVRQCLDGVLRYCDETGGLSVRDFRTQEPVNFVAHLSPTWKGQADGIVLVTTRPEGSTDRQMADWVLSGGVPAVFLGADVLDPRIPTFHLSFATLGQLAAEHLMQCGCESYLYFGLQESTGSGRRGEAFGKALAREGHQLAEYSTNYPYTGVFENEAHARNEKKLASLLKKMRQPVGVWALNDYFACAVCQLCESLGLAVPEQVKVLGVGDMVVARTHRPTLSTIRTPGDELAYLAARALHKQLTGARSAPKVTEMSATELVVRGSTIGDLPARGSLSVGLEYIARHACSHLTVEQVSDAMGISRSSLEKKFQQQLGRSPGQEIQRVRLEKAQSLLRKTQLSVSRIASMIGFEETASFSKFFSKQTGLSPLAYRRQPTE